VLGIAAQRRACSTRSSWVKPRSRDRLARTASALKSTALRSGASAAASVVLPAPGRPMIRIFRCTLAPIVRCSLTHLSNKRQVIAVLDGRSNSTRSARRGGSPRRNRLHLRHGLAVPAPHNNCGNPKWSKSLQVVVCANPAIEGHPRRCGSQYNDIPHAARHKPTELLEGTQNGVSFGLRERDTVAIAPIT
jgi:hypothetical protein